MNEKGRNKERNEMGGRMVEGTLGNVAEMEFVSSRLRPDWQLVASDISVKGNGN